MKKQLVLVTLAALCTALTANAWGRRGCGTSACAPKACYSKPCAQKACVDVDESCEVVNVPATQKVYRKVVTTTSVGPIECPGCDCTEQHKPVSTNGGFL